MKILMRLVAVLVLAAPFSLPAAQDGADYGEAELDRMLAPIALYPDSVLSQLLIAATYPLEVAQAARWSRRHSELKGEAAADAVEDKDWDPSVKALVAFPELLARMDEDLEWTEQLGEAFLAQEGEVMDRVQYLRQRADDAGNLDSSEHVRVVREREVIYIEPVRSHLLYIPYYDPWVIYGNWWWPSYPPYCWSYWGGHPVRYYQSYGPSFYWGVGFRISPVFYFSGFHWHDRHVVVIPPHRYTRSHGTYSAREFHRHRDAQRWQHDSRHRRGVEYRSERLNRDHGRMRRDAVDREQRLSRHPSSVDRRGTQREREVERRESQHRPDADSRRQHRRGEAERSERPLHQTPRRGAERETRQEAPRSETRAAPGSPRGESNGPREQDRQAQRPERDPPRGQSPSRDDESARNSRRESAPADARGEQSDGREQRTRSTNNRGEEPRSERGRNRSER